MDCLDNLKSDLAKLTQAIRVNTLDADAYKERSEIFHEMGIMLREQRF